MCFISLFCLKNTFEIAVTVSTVLWLLWFIYWEFIKKVFCHFEVHSLPAVRHHILIDIYLINKLIYNLNLVQVEQCTKLNHEVHRDVPFFHWLSVKRADSTCIQPQISPWKHIQVKKQSQQIQTRDVEGQFDYIRTCICSPSKITFSIGTSQYKVAICPLSSSWSYLKVLH